MDTVTHWFLQQSLLRTEVQLDNPGPPQKWCQTGVYKQPSTHTSTYYSCTVCNTMEQGLCNSRASGQLSVPSFNSCCAYRWFAAEHLMGRTNWSIAAGTSAQQQRCHRMAFSSKCGQCYADSRVDEAEHRLVNTVVILTTFSAFHECVCPWLDSNAT